MITLHDLLRVFCDTDVMVLTTRNCLLKQGKAEEVINELSEVLGKNVIRAWVHDSSEVKNIRLSGKVNNMHTEKLYESETGFSGTLKADVEVLKKSHIDIVIDMEEKYR